MNIGLGGREVSLVLVGRLHWYNEGEHGREVSKEFPGAGNTGGKEREVLRWEIFLQHA